MDNLHTLTQTALADIQSAASLAALNQVRVQYLGKKGAFSRLMQSLKNLPAADKPAMGASINTARQSVIAALTERHDALETQAIEESMAQECIDVTLPGRCRQVGSIHPVTRTIERISDYFRTVGFQVESGPEIEDEFHNFEALNIPPHHPARAMHDTFYTRNGQVLRTHTSPVQIRAMKRCAAQGFAAPLAIICPGKVYRCDSDQTHSPMFHQVEGLYVAHKATFAELKSLLSGFLRHFFDRDDLNLRFRPSYFPFTEPSAEVDIEWGRHADGSVKWLEVLGCGMVHPHVFGHADIDAEKYRGFAFGLGVERFAMLRYQVKDLRQFFDNDLRFLSQFQ